MQVFHVSEKEKVPQLFQNTGSRLIHYASGTKYTMVGPWFPNIIHIKVRERDPTSSKRRCTEIYFPSLSTLFSLILETKISDKDTTGLENFKASKFAKHLSRWTAGGASNESRLAKGEILMNLHYRAYHQKESRYNWIEHLKIFNNIEMKFPEMDAISSTPT